MEIISFTRLSDKEQNAVYAFMCGLVSAKPFASVQDMVRTISLRTFDGGENFLTFWENGSVAGTIGVITQDARARGEVFLTYLFASPDDASLIPVFIRSADQVAGTREGVTAKTVVQLGIRAGMSYLAPWVKNAGFAENTRVLEMRRDAVLWETPGSDLEFSPLSPQSLTDFVSIHNAAFLKSPNGGQIRLEEARETMEKAPCQDLLQVGSLVGKPAVVFELQIRDGGGWIENLAVNPAIQGRGFGRETLSQAISTLVRHRVSDIRLQVVESNTTAVHLYRKAGFVPSRVISTWFTRCDKIQKPSP